MVKVFYGIDEEFAAATGDNVDVTPTTSVFDNPPNAFKDLVVTSNPGDDDPNVFELGDTYDVSWGGFEGGGMIEDAVVIRSDAAPDGGGIIVLEGTDDNGEPAQIIWTPGFNLEQWYNDNYNPSAEPQFYTADQNSSYIHRVNCFVAGTLLETKNGPRPIEALRPGDDVMTRDAGPRRILWTGQRTMPGYGPACPVRFAPDTIGNTRALFLSQQHRVAIRSNLAELMFGNCEVLVPAKALVGQCGIGFAPCVAVTYVHLLLDDHQLLLAEGAAPCESVLPGAMTDGWLAIEHTAIQAICKDATYQAIRPVLTFREALCVANNRLPAPPPALAIF